MPVTLFLIVTGSLVAQGAMDVWSAIAIAAVGSVAGDQIGYAVGRWGGKALVARLSGMLGNAERLRKLDAKAKSWGGPGVFFRRWLVTPLGPWINLASGTRGLSGETKPHVNLSRAHRVNAWHAVANKMPLGSRNPT